MTTATSPIGELADRLATAAESRAPCAPIRDAVDASDVDTAYRIQAELTKRRIRAGARRVGRKIGLTSPAVQQQLGVEQPDFGVLLDDMQVPSGGVVRRSSLLQPKAEGEVAFLLRSDLDGDPNIDEIRAAVGTVHCAIEIVDSRISNWDISIVDTVADNASSGMFVVSDTGIPLADIQTAEVTMRLVQNDVLASSGHGRACLGDPLNALLWLARTAARYQDPLRAGEVVLSGALGPMVSVAAGDRISVDIDGLGSTNVQFS